MKIYLKLKLFFKIQSYLQYKYYRLNCISPQISRKHKATVQYSYEKYRIGIEDKEYIVCVSLYDVFVVYCGVVNSNDKRHGDDELRSTKEERPCEEEFKLWEALTKFVLNSCVSHESHIL